MCGEPAWLRAWWHPSTLAKTAPTSHPVPADSWLETRTLTLPWEWGDSLMIKGPAFHVRIIPGARTETIPTVRGSLRTRHSMDSDARGNRVVDERGVVGDVVLEHGAALG